MSNKQYEEDLGVYLGKTFEELEIILGKTYAKDNKGRKNKISKDLFSQHFQTNENLRIAAPTIVVDNDDDDLALTKKKYAPVPARLLYCPPRRCSQSIMCTQSRTGVSSAHSSPSGAQSAETIMNLITSIMSDMKRATFSYDPSS